jgi:hypothetical protein
VQPHFLPAENPHLCDRGHRPSLKQQLHTAKPSFLFGFPQVQIREVGMKAVLAAVLLVTVVVASAQEAPAQSVDPQSEGRTIVAQRFCPNGRC